MALMTAQQMSGTGTSPTFGAVNSTDTIRPDGGGLLVLHVKNTNGSTRDVTITVPGNTNFGQAQPDIVKTVAVTTGDVEIPLYRANELADPATGLITVGYSATAGVTAALKRYS